MRYMKPTILNEAKAASLIMRIGIKNSDLFDNLLPFYVRSDATAYEADE